MFLIAQANKQRKYISSEKMNYQLNTYYGSTTVVGTEDIIKKRNMPLRSLQSHYGGYWNYAKTIQSYLYEYQLGDTEVHYCLLNTFSTPLDPPLPVLAAYYISSNTLTLCTH